MVKSKFQTLVDSLPDPGTSLLAVNTKWKPKNMPNDSSDRFLASVAAFQRMSDAEFIAIAEECYRHCDVPRNGAGWPIPKNSDSHDVVMHHVVIPELIARLKRDEKIERAIQQVVSRSPYADGTNGKFCLYCGAGLKEKHDDCAWLIAGGKPEHFAHLTESSKGLST